MRIEFAAGDRVSARGLSWDVIEVVPLGPQSLLRMRCASGDLAGLQWEMLHPAESVEPLRARLRPDAPGPLSAWRLYHQACLLDQVAGPRDMPLAPPGRVRIEPYQLVPLMRALELPRPRLLLADGVGLGKTVEAALIICELIVRRRAHRVLVVSPAGPLLAQWMQELRQRFGLRFTAIADASSLLAQRRRLELGGNPFDAMALCLTSLDFAKQEHVLEELERSTWDLAIIDEAHHCISTGGIDAEATQRRRLAEVISRRSDGLLLLTATPHDGFDAHFASLIELLDPSLVDGRGNVAGTGYRRHVVRRLKSHIRDPETAAPVFRERHVVPVRVEVRHPAVRSFHEALAALIAPRLRRAGVREHADALAFVSLLKRSVSTIGSCVNTLRVVAERYGQVDTEALRRERARSLRAYRRRLRRFGVLDEAAESDVAELEADSMAADLQSFAADDLARLMQAGPTSDALQALIRLGVTAATFDPKVDAVAREIRAIRAARPGANVLVYTEYADSQLSVLCALRDAVGGEVLSIDGLDDEAERARITDRFAESDGIVLISTDTMAEGLNLQQRCCDLIHLDLPYNPNRLEQRNGRIDRYGQRHETQIRYLYLAGTFEERLLLRLIEKYEKARSQLEFMPATLGVTADAATSGSGLVAGFAERQAGLFDDEPTKIRTLDRAAEDADAYRDLLHEIDRAFDGFEHSAVRHGWLAAQGSRWDAEPTAATRLRGASQVLDLPAFVAAAAGVATGEGCLHLSDDWLAGLDDLPGVDRQARVLRFTRDPDQVRDRHGHRLAFLGQAHPLVRRAALRSLQVSDASYDKRVSVAIADRDMPLALLLSYGCELRCATRVELQRIFVVLLPMHGRVTEIADPGKWLRFAQADRNVPAEEIWQRCFAPWVTSRQSEAIAVATAGMHRETERIAAERRACLEREAQRLSDWLHERAANICGAAEPQTNDLFGRAPSGPGWRTAASPRDRLAAYAGDGENPATRRRAANDALELFLRRQQEHAAMGDMAPAALREIGMLMLVPAELAA